MRTWKRATDRKQCGAQWDCWIVSGAPYLELAGGAGWKKYRCAKHAGGPAPDVIEEAVPQMPTRKPLPEFSSLAGLAKRVGPKVLTFDPKMAQAGDND